MNEAKRRKNRTFYGSLLIALVIFIDGYIINLYSSILVKDILSALLPILPTIGAVMIWYDGKMNYSETAKRYKRLFDVYDYVNIKIEESIEEKNRGKVEKCIKILAKNALAENYQWVQDNRSVFLKP